MTVVDVLVVVALVAVVDGLGSVELVAVELVAVVLVSVALVSVVLVSVALVSVALVSVALVSVALVSVALVSVALVSVALVSVVLVSVADGSVVSDVDDVAVDVNVGTTVVVVRVSVIDGRVEVVGSSVGSTGPSVIVGRPVGLTVGPTVGVAEGGRTVTSPGTSSALPASSWSPSSSLRLSTAARRGAAVPASRLGPEFGAASASSSFAEIEPSGSALAGSEESTAMTTTNDAINATTPIT